MSDGKHSSVGSGVLKVGGTLVLVGVIGIFLGTNVYPDSYWLGSGIIFGPLFLFGVLLVFGVGIARALAPRGAREDDKNNT